MAAQSRCRRCGAPCGQDGQRKLYSARLVAEAFCDRCGPLVDALVGAFCSGNEIEVKVVQTWTLSMVVREGEVR